MYTHSIERAACAATYVCASDGCNVDNVYGRVQCVCITCSCRMYALYLVFVCWQTQVDWLYVPNCYFCIVVIAFVVLRTAVKARQLVDDALAVQVGTIHFLKYVTIASGAEAVYTRPALIHAVAQHALLLHVCHVTNQPLHCVILHRRYQLLCQFGSRL